MTVADCPVCNGTGKVPLTEWDKKWWPDKTERECLNCGGQTMYGKATGKTNLRKDGTPCVHEYSAMSSGRCYTVYTCKHCSYRYDIDSGD